MSTHAAESSMPLASLATLCEMSGLVPWLPQDLATNHLLTVAEPRAKGN